MIDLSNYYFAADHKPGGLRRRRPAATYAVETKIRFKILSWLCQ